MELKIDESFAKSFNEWKTKEVQSKTKKVLKKKIKELDLSSDSESEDEIETKKLCDDYVKKVDDLLAKLDHKGSEMSNIEPIFLKTSEEPKHVTTKSKPLHVKEYYSQLLKSGEHDPDLIKEHDNLDDKITTEESKFYIDIEFDFEKDILKEPEVPREVPQIDSEAEDIGSVSDYPEELSNEDIMNSNEQAVVVNMSRNQDTLRSRSTKRKENRIKTKDRKQNELKETLKQLKTIKMKELEEKFEKIRKTNPSILKYLKPEDLDEDFDPDKHNSIMDNFFEQTDQDYPEDEEKPVFSDDNCDMDYDGSDEEQISTTTMSGIPEDNTCHNTKSKKKTQWFTKVDTCDQETGPAEHVSFKKFMKKHTQFICDDIIKDVDGNHTVCKFKYRSVVPQTFGLTFDELIRADNKELNKWASLKKISRIRTDREEERDSNKYSSEAKLQKKKEILTSLYKDESKDDAVNDEPKTCKASKKRLRKARNKEKLLAASSVDIEGLAEEVDQAVQEETKRKKAKKETITVDTVNVEMKEAAVEETKDKKPKKSKETIDGDNVKTKKSKNKKSRGDLPNLKSSRLQSFGVNEGYYKYKLNTN